MASGKELAERRQNRRFAVKRKFELLAISRFDFVRCHIVDISTNGLSYSYDELNGHPVDVFGISILLQADFWGLSNLPVETVWVDEIDDGNKTRRISGVRFGSLTDKKRAQLERFIQQYTAG